MSSPKCSIGDMVCFHKTRSPIKALGDDTMMDDGEHLMNTKLRFHPSLRRTRHEGSVRVRKTVIFMRPFSQYPCYIPSTNQAGQALFDDGLGLRHNAVQKFPAGGDIFYQPHAEADREIALLDVSLFEHLLSHQP